MALIEDAIRQATDALNRGDTERFLSFHADDVVIHFPGRSPFAGDQRDDRPSSTRIDRRPGHQGRLIDLRAGRGAEGRT